MQVRRTTTPMAKNKDRVVGDRRLANLVAQQGDLRQSHLGVKAGSDRNACSKPPAERMDTETMFDQQPYPIGQQHPVPKSRCPKRVGVRIREFRSAIGHAASAGFTAAMFGCDDANRPGQPNYHEVPFRLFDRTLIL